MVHFDSAVCVLLVWLLVWNVHRHIAHSPLPVADNYRPITVCFIVRCLHYCVSFHPSRPHELLLVALGSTPPTALLGHDTLCTCTRLGQGSVVIYQFIVFIDMFRGHWCCPIVQQNHEFLPYTMVPD